MVRAGRRRRHAALAPRQRRQHQPPPAGHRPVPPRARRQHPHLRLPWLRPQQRRTPPPRRACTATPRPRCATCSRGRTWTRRRSSTSGARWASPSPTELAVRHRPYGLILESGFPSITYMANVDRPWLPAFVVHRIIAARYDSASKIGSLNVPVLIVHGDADDTVPLRAGQALFDAAREPKSLYVVEGANHDGLSMVGGRPYHRAVAGVPRWVGLTSPRRSRGGNTRVGCWHGKSIYAGHHGRAV